MGIDTNIMSLCVLEAEISENMKFADFAGDHFGNDVIQIVHPILVMVASIFHGERGPMNKIKQVPYCPGEGARGVYRAHGLVRILSKKFIYNVLSCMGF